MHPELEDFLESALDSVPPVSENIGRAVVEPDYNSAPDEQDSGHFAAQFADCLRAEPLTLNTPPPPHGREVTIGPAWPLVQKYIRRITLHADPVQGSWIEVAPPGSWI